MKSLTATMTPGVRAWGKTIAILGGSLATYVAAALLGTLLTGDAIAGAAISALVVTVLAIIYRWRSTGTPLAPAPQPRALTVGFWLAAVAGLIVCWLAGQTAAEWVYATWGSAGFDAVNATKRDSPLGLLLLTMLFLAPIGEESLMRGIAYPALRKHWPPLAAAFVTATVFALLHGNPVQIVLTVPLGLLLAFVYEASQRLWPVMLMHVLFNMAAVFIPKELVESIARPPMVIALAVAAALLLFALTPGRYPVEVSKKTTDPDDESGNTPNGSKQEEARQAS
jgi:membrane protease YdiL (CAAX protease family)